MKGITIIVYEPLVVGSALIDDRLGSAADSYSHEIRAVGGYTAADFTLTDNRNNLDDWLANGLGRHIEVFDQDLNQIWEGFVNEIEMSIGGLRVKRGPLLNIANEVIVAYTTISYATTPPIPGYATQTDPATNAVSIDSYGTGEMVLSGGTGTEAEMEQLRDTYLATYKDPETSQELTVGGSTQAASLSVSCRGYYDWLNRYYYVQTASTGTINLSAKLQAIIAANPDAVLSTDYAQIVTNTLPVGAYENDSSRAMALIKDLIARGDSSDNRYNFGFYNDRKVYYGAVPTTIGYTHRLADSGQVIQTYKDGATVYPWNVLPGQWLFIPDFLIGRTQPTTDLRLDPRNLFIEAVRYTAPWTVAIGGGKVDTLSQRLARMGLGGIS